ncbi:MAG: peptide chain release factor N(5)-glutamine methyltransferase, partial [Myroides sp.]|nr:peptide chain release factor N(5)-glutamine methyltransferase [Myroides sp.]
IPIQYIFEKAYFYGYEFKVSPATLIPRRETEELVEWVLSEMNRQPEKKWRILDIGTGTGCIPITIKKEFPLAEVFAMDISTEAMKIAKENAENLNASVTFIEQNILSTEQLDSYDIIISNPPYVRNLEKAEIKKNVLAYEPHLALFVEDNDPLIFYRKIAQLAQKSLPENGLLFFEINQYLGEKMQQMVAEYFKTIELRKDLQGNDRMMKCSTIR